MKRFARAFLLLLLLGLLAEGLLRLSGWIYLRRLYTTAAGARGGAINVVCLGESSTAGLWVRPEDSYPGQLQAALQVLYRNPGIRVLVPPHVGQNTSQVANRIDDYLALCHPRLVVLMVGYNNEWSLAESHIPRFLPTWPAEALKVRLLIALEGLRLFKVGRLAYLRLALRGNWDDPRQSVGVALGHPELVRYPPEPWVYAFAAANRQAFVALWRADVRQIIRAARSGNARSLLMTYHINPTYLRTGEFTAMAREEAVSLVRNDAAFAPLLEQGIAPHYLFHDDWHPNRRGYAIIARNALAEIAEHDLLGLGHAEPARLAEALSHFEVDAFPPYGPGRLRFAATNTEGFLGRGWSRPEGAYRWTDGDRAELRFSLPAVGSRILRIRLRPFLAPERKSEQRMLVRFNDQVIARLALRDPEPRDYSWPVPADLVRPRNVLTLELPDAAAPSRLGVGRDPRMLGVAAEWLELIAPN